MSDAGPSSQRRRKPAISYDFGKGYATTNLTRLAVQAMRNRGLDTRKMEQELRSYLRYRGVEEARPVRVLQIVKRYVDVYPVSMIEMEQAVGARAARQGLPEDFVPEYCWNAQDFLYYVDIRYGHAHRTELYDLIESAVGDRESFLAVSRRHLRRLGYDHGQVARWVVRRDRNAAKAKAG